MACLHTQTAQFPVQPSQACTALGNELEVFSPAREAQASQVGEGGNSLPCSGYVKPLLADFPLTA